MDVAPGTVVLWPREAETRTPSQGDPSSRKPNPELPGSACPTPSSARDQEELKKQRLWLGPGGRAGFFLSAHILALPLRCPCSDHVNLALLPIASSHQGSLSCCFASSKRALPALGPQGQQLPPLPGPAAVGVTLVLVKGRARLVWSRGSAQRRCCRRLLRSPRDTGCGAGAVAPDHGHCHPPSIPLSVCSSTQAPVHRVSPSFHCSNNLFSTLGAKASPLAPARTSIFSCL